MKVIIVCHTEAGIALDKKILFTFEKDCVNTSSRNLLGIAKKYNAKITFAICPEVANKFPWNEFIEESHEIGLHIHPNASHITALRDYSYGDQLEIIEIGKERLKDIGFTPNIFVAGKWSENNDTIRIIEKLGFCFDCTPLPGFRSEFCDWSKLKRFSMPYHPHRDDYQKQGNSPLHMVPVSTAYPHGVASPEIVPLCGISWLKACFLEYYKNSLPLFHICLHSPAMASDYYIRVMEEFLEFISNHKEVEFCTVSEIGNLPSIDFRGSFWPYIFQINKHIVKTGINLSYKKIRERL